MKAPWRKPASAFFLVGTPAIYGTILAWLTYLLRSGQHEAVAWFLWAPQRPERVFQRRRSGRPAP